MNQMQFHQTGGWTMGNFFGQQMQMWMPPFDLWHLFANDPMPSPDHFLAQAADDAPHRWFTN